MRSDVIDNDGFRVLGVHSIRAEFPFHNIVRLPCFLPRRRRESHERPTSIQLQCRRQIERDNQHRFPKVVAIYSKHAKTAAAPVRGFRQENVGRK